MNVAFSRISNAIDKLTLGKAFADSAERLLEAKP